MANTSKFSWLRKLITPSRISLQMDDSLPIRGLSANRDSNGSRKTPKLPGKDPQIKSRPFKMRILPKAIDIRKNCVVRSLDKTKRGRNKQEGKSHGSQERSPIRQNMFKRCRQEEQPSCSHDRRLGLRELATRNIEKIVRESQTKLMNQQVKVIIGEERKRKNTSNDVREKSQRAVAKAKCIDKGKVMEKLVKMVITRDCWPTVKKRGDKDVRFARTPRKLVLKRSPCSSSSTDNDTSSDPLHPRHSYQIKIVYAPAKKPKKGIAKTKGIAKKPKVVRSAVVSHLLKEEQKRLDILRSEWVQLKGMENAAKERKNPQSEESKMPSDPDTGTPPELDLKSLIVDPKSFLTQVHVKSKILPVDLNDNISLDKLLVENPDVFSEFSKDDNVGDKGEPN